MARKKAGVKETRGEKPEIPPQAFSASLGNHGDVIPGSSPRLSQFWNERQAETWLYADPICVRTEILHSGLNRTQMVNGNVVRLMPMPVRMRCRTFNQTHVRRPVTPSMRQ